MGQSTNSSLKEQIIAKAWSDPAFKASLIADPKAALKEHFNVDVPDSLEIVVAEEAPNRVTLVIPPNPAEYATEVSNVGDTW
ncbi:NHLP leader peptide family natural product precursor [Paenibacillus rhizovicinus]|uniref:NHLP leader peptide family natural product n=1 Tax=Paenibacillus rhizovicinus TaxID=2704463 RepID=A0A6C0NUL8_9BACL|nr:NHLP leader peptide family RiPP precursor [Paenibacillus rhizovicinus]QHW29877.1 NHLP leader peptide family natural product precursor [Paenibacillus rhizovicinus]